MTALFFFSYLSLFAVYKNYLFDGSAKRIYFNLLSVKKGGYKGNRAAQVCMRMSRLLSLMYDVAQLQAISR